MGKLVQIAQSSQRDCLYTHSKQMADEVNAMNDQREASSPTCYVADYRRSLFRHGACCTAGMINDCAIYSSSTAHPQAITFH